MAQLETNMIKADKYYIDNLNDIMNNGCFDENPRGRYSDGEKSHSKFITQSFEKYDISKGEFPITTLRNTAIKTGIREILWIYQKQSNSLTLAHDMGINWWDDWEVTETNGLLFTGTIGQRYGATISRYDLMNELLDRLKDNPFGRRHIINMYQYTDLNETSGLYPCAYETLWSVRKKEDSYYLDLTLVQRSNDYIVAGYINKIQYVALMMMVASHLGYEVGVFSHLVQNLHVYDRHFDAVKELLERKPLNIQPTIKLLNNKSFYDFTVDDFIIDGINDIKPIKSKLELAI